MKDAYGTEIEAGLTLKRIKAAPGVIEGHKYTVIIRNWKDPSEEGGED